jgi:hypothetical protein
VTAQRVRDGEPAALNALVERRGTAVLAYCEEVAEPGGATAAAGEAFARFRREVVAADEPRALDPEAVLLRGTRQAAAAAAPRSVAQRGLLARRLGATCVLVPELLAARAERSLTTADRLRLSRHLERCSSCREAEERFERGEQAWREAPNTPPAPEVADQLLAALRGAAPITERDGSEPDPAASNGAPPALALEGNDTPTLSWDAADVAAATGGRGPRSWGWVATRIIVPAVVFAVAFVIALAVAGVFGGSDGSGAGSIETQSTLPPGQIRVHDRPVTTPLPDTAIGAVQPPAASAPESQTAAAPAEVAAAVPVVRRETATPQLSATVRSHAESAAPPPAPAATTPSFQPPPAP